MSETEGISPALFVDIVNTINRATTLEQLFQSTMEASPITMASYHHFPSVGALDHKTFGTFHSYNMPEAIEAHYRTYKASKPDPGLLAVFAKGRFMWLSDLIVEPSVVQANHSGRYEAAKAIIGNALCIPLFGPNNRRGYMLAAGDFLEKESCEFLPYQVQSLALIFHSRFCVLIQNIQRQIKLTPREIEVIELLTYGKTNKDIADILNLSVSTVAGYVKSIFLKLEVSDRVSASMRAQSMKVIF